MQKPWRPAHAHVVAAAIILRLPLTRSAHCAGVTDILGEFIAGNLLHGLGSACALPPRRDCLDDWNMPSERLFAEISGAS